jgi:hypothetical protein
MKGQLWSGGRSCFLNSAGEIEKNHENLFFTILDNPIKTASFIKDHQFIQYIEELTTISLHKNMLSYLMFIGACIIVIIEEWKTNFMLLAIVFHFSCAQHVSDINISIIRSLWLCCWITTWVVFFSVRCVLQICCGWFWVVHVLQPEASACKQWVAQKKRETLITV